MPIEKERKFLCEPKIVVELQKKLVTKNAITQGYIMTEPGKELRIRKTEDTQGVFSYSMTFKGKCVSPASDTLDRLEVEVPLSPDDGEALLKMVKGKLIRKERYIYLDKQICWEIDVFTEPHPFVMAETESVLNDVDLPAWLGQEVTHDKAYQNRSLAGL